MSVYKHCDKCKDFHYTDKECPPVYKIYYEDYYGNSYGLIHAYTFSSAAEKFANQYNVNNDYCLMNESITIDVELDGIRRTFEVYAEPSVDYYVTEK